MKEYLQESQEVLESLKSQENGLSSAEASARLEQYGKNKLKEGKKTPLIVRFLEELKDPMIIILIVAALISGVTAFYSGESFADVIIILIVVIINAVLGVVQESKAEKAIAALQEITAATSKVIRDGHQVTVKSEELVPGDVIVLEAGDAVPADARVLESASMKIEEAALTGESVPVNKKADVLELNGEKDIPLGDRKNMMYMGSTVVYGRGRATAADQAEPAEQDFDYTGYRYLCDYLCSGSVPCISGYHRRRHAGYLYGSGQPGGSCDSGRSCSRCNDRSFDRSYKDVPEKRGNPKTYRGGNTGMYPDYLFR